MDMQGLLFFWLAISVLLALLLQAFLWIFLRQRGVPTNYFSIGTPGYLDAKYIGWCKQNDRNYLAIIALRIFLVLSIIFAVVAIQATP